jgi:tripartite-type tricarboxylate transporter receptor subunit TctC
MFKLIFLKITIIILFFPLLSFAQQWPNKPIHLIVPFAPGGVNDLVARIIADPFSKAMKQPIVVENKAGAGGMVGLQYVSKSPADGHTIGMVASFISSAPALNSQLNFDPNKDITPISLFGYNNLLLVINSSVKVNTFQELLTLAKSKPGSIHYASTGIGTSQHYAGELIKLETGADLIHIPYKGGSPAIADLVSGQVEMMFSSSAIRPHLESGKTKALAVSYIKRSPLFPDLPTIAESGIPGFSVSEWYGIVGPPNLSKEIVKRFNDEIALLFQNQEIITKLTQPGVEVQTTSSKEFTEYIKSEYIRFKDIVSRANIKPE